MAKTIYYRKPVKPGFAYYPSLKSKPGNLIHQEIADILFQMSIVKKIAGKWEVMLNHIMHYQKLSINHHYAYALIQRADNSGTVNQFLKNNLQEARWFLKSIKVVKKLY